MDVSEKGNGMKIGPQYNVYLGTRQTVWHRDINGAKYSFTYVPSREPAVSSFVQVERDTPEGWETVHCFRS